MSTSAIPKVIALFIDSHQQVAAGYVAHTPTASQWSLAAPHQRKRKADNTTSAPEDTQQPPEQPLQLQQWRHADQQAKQSQDAHEAETQGAAAQGIQQEAPDWVALAAFKHLLKPKITFTCPAPGGQQHQTSHNQRLQPQQQQLPQQQRQAQDCPDQHTANEQQEHQQQQQQQQQQQEEEEEHQKQQQEQGGVQYHCCNLYNTWVANPTGYEVVAAAHHHPVLLPPRSAWVMSDATHLAPLVAGVREAGGAALLVADPPWENASARRAAAYASMSPGQLERLPLAQLLRQGARGTLVALWVTNRPRIHRQLLTRLLPAWGLTRAATWYWLKVTHSGEPVTPLGVTHRQPWEQLWLCRPTGNGQQQQDDAAQGVRQEGALDGVTVDDVRDDSSSVTALSLPSSEQPSDRCNTKTTGAAVAAALCCSRSCHLADQPRCSSKDGPTPQAVLVDEAARDVLAPLSAAADTTGAVEAAVADAGTGEQLAMDGLMQQALSDLQRRGYFQQPSAPDSGPQGACQSAGMLQQAAADVASFQQQLREAGAAEQLPEHVVLVSVPGAHSRKPPVGQLLSAWVEGADAAAAGRAGGLSPADVPEDQVVKVELFARELTPGWVSWGNEVLRFQDASLFVPV